MFHESTHKSGHTLVRYNHFTATLDGYGKNGYRNLENTEGGTCVAYSIKLTESVEDLCRCITHRGVRNRRPENISRVYLDDQDESYNSTAIEGTFHSMEYRVS